MFKTILTAVGAFFAGLVQQAEGKAEEVGKDIVQGVESVLPEAEAYFSDLTNKWVPIAVSQVQAAATDPNLLSSDEKRSAVFTKLAQQLEGDGHDILSSGFNSFVNMLVEIGVNTVKLIEGTFLGSATAAAPAATEDKPAS